LKHGNEDSARTERHRWESAILPLLSAPTEALWRAHSDAVNCALLERWLAAEPCRMLLKTDLFDEAMGAGLFPLLARHARRVTALDVAPSVLAAAGSRHPQLLAVAADVRQLPFVDETFEVVVSNSTLDHFEARDQILVALRGLHRVLCRGGRLLLTLDNLANPVVAARSVLPFALLRRLRLADYPAGATCGPWRLRRMLREAGFEVLETATLLHCLRAPAVAMARRLQHAGTREERVRFLRRLRRWERLAQLPTRFLTGYYIGISARKP
jgi:ubiquinone/menaquinone biosynthesis C-methylase UbiE